MRAIRLPIVRLLGLATAFCVLSGCGSDRSDLDILPSPDAARAALEKALTAWKSGEKVGKIPGAESPRIQVLDSVWKTGAKLTSFEIVQALDKPGPNGPGPRWFAVKLTLEKASEPEQANYAVLGLDPLWVYREVDYKRTCGME